MNLSRRKPGTPSKHTGGRLLNKFHQWRKVHILTSGKSNHSKSPSARKCGKKQGGRSPILYPECAFLEPWNTSTNKMNPSNTCKLKRKTRPSKVTQTKQKKTIVSQAQAIQACHQLCKSQGMCCDLASGMNFAAALKLAEQLGDEPATIVTIFPSNGLKELSTVYNPEWLEENGFSC
mmetsp:Transcript_8397/g.15775  ORF Transcript_8397/g.15775 Transcript_8397/m.15775 type:complete len:177 (+) Transcript_8397:347-877(+)